MVVTKSSQPSFQPAKSRRNQHLWNRINLCFCWRVLAGWKKKSSFRSKGFIGAVDDLASAEPKGDSQSQDANGQGRYDVPPVSGGKTRNFWHKNWPQRVTQHGKTSTTTLDPTKNGVWKIPSASYLFLLPHHKKIPVHSEILSHFLRSMPLAFTLAKSRKTSSGWSYKSQCPCCPTSCQSSSKRVQGFFPSLLNDKNEQCQKNCNFWCLSISNHWHRAKTTPKIGKGRDAIYFAKWSSGLSSKQSFNARQAGNAPNPCCSRKCDISIYTSLIYTCFF